MASAAFIIPLGPHTLGLVPFCGRDSGCVEVLGVLQLNVCAKRFIEHFAGLLLSTRSFGHDLFDADDLMALRALAEAMTGAIHFVPGGYFYFHRTPKLTDKDTIVLADFTNTTGDPVFDGTLRQGMAVQLEQSPF